MANRRALAISGVFWFALYIALALAPLGLVLVVPGESPPKRSFWVEFSVALGFVGLAMMTLQFVLTARFEWLKAPFGSDIIYAFHRQISIISVLLILAHPIILLVVRTDDMLRRLNPITAPWPARFALASVLCLLVLVIISIWRRTLKLEYDTWRRTHALLAVLAIGLAIAHIWLINHYFATPLQRSLWLGYTGVWVALILYVRVIKPWMELRTPYRVVSIVPQAGDCAQLTLEPQGHPGVRFAPGQFAWITAFHSPFTDHEHPFSFSGSASRTPRLEFTIKNLGDFTSRIPKLAPGDRVYVDGPFGALSADRHPDAAGFVFIAGGIGITPMISHLRTFADRGEKRPVLLIYAGRELAALTYRDEIDALVAQGTLNLRVVYALSAQESAGDGVGAGGSGGDAQRVAIERGFVTRELMQRHLPRADGHEHFICGPDPMMDAVERALVDLGVPMSAIHSERFNLV